MPFTSRFNYGPHPAANPQNLRPGLFLDSLSTQLCWTRPESNTAPPRGPPASRSFVLSSASNPAHRRVNRAVFRIRQIGHAHNPVHWFPFPPNLRPQPVHLTSDPTSRLPLLQAASKVTPPVCPAQRPPRAGRPHQADELRQCEADADPDAVSHLPCGPHRVIIVREKFLKQSAFGFRAAGT